MCSHSSNVLDAWIFSSAQIMRPCDVTLDFSFALLTHLQGVEACIATFLEHFRSLVQQNIWCLPIYIIRVPPPPQKEFLVPNPIIKFKVCVSVCVHFCKFGTKNLPAEGHSCLICFHSVHINTAERQISEIKTTLAPFNMGL
jgi:hypothetical protein